MTQDLRFALRALLATPIVTAASIIVLALGIGANTAIFSIVNSILLRTLPVDEPHRLAIVSSGPVAMPEAYSYHTWNHIRERATRFGGAFAMQAGTPGRVLLTHDGETRSAESLFVSGDFFETLGVKPILGRTISLKDAALGGGAEGPVAVISYRLWQGRFGGAAHVIGSTVAIEGAPFRIIGVAPPHFLGLEVGRAFDVALPIETYALVRLGPNASFDVDLEWLRVILRLKQNQSLEEATAALRVIQTAIRADTPPQKFPSAFMTEPFRLESISRGVSTFRERFRPPLIGLIVIVAFVLLIACANIANLFLARGTARRRELSVQLALGASRARLVRQLATESIVLGLLGATLGLVFAMWASQAVVLQLTTPLTPVVLDLSLQWPVLGFTAAVMLATVLLFGILPAIRTTQANPIDALNEHGRTVTPNRAGALQASLLVAQVALTLTLCVAAGLLVATFARLARMSVGFDADRVVIGTVSAGHADVAPDSRLSFYERLVTTAAATPGVAHAVGSFATPTLGFSGTVLVTPDGASQPQPVEFNVITPGWPSTYGTPLHAGRDFEDVDGRESQPVALANVAFVRTFLASHDAIGASVPVAVEMPGAGQLPIGAKTIVGVVGDAVYRSVREPDSPTLYFPMAQWFSVAPAIPLFISLRAEGPWSSDLSRHVAASLAATDSSLGVTFRPLTEQMNASIAHDRVIALLAGFFGLLALLISGVGLHGVVLYFVSRREREIGIRLALGSTRLGVVRLVTRRVALLVAAGLVAGSAISLWVGRFIAPLLYGVQSGDVVTMIGGFVAVAAVAVMASWVPTWRAGRIDPAHALRSE